MSVRFRRPRGADPRPAEPPLCAACAACCVPQLPLQQRAKRRGRLAVFRNQFVPLRELLAKPRATGAAGGAQLGAELLRAARQAGPGT